MTRLDFYYWGAMCPLNMEMLALLDEYRDRLNIVRHDISGAPGLAKEMRMYYPTLTVVDGKTRYYSPLSAALLDRLCRGGLPREKPYVPELGTVERAGKIIPLTAASRYLAGQCTGRMCVHGCDCKAGALAEQGLPVFGFLNVEGKRLLGGAEFVPSELVPYDIPKDPRTAFLTCVYLSDGEYDVKSPPLRALEQYLSGQYRDVLVISDERGVFPNGDLAFFTRNGYTDWGVVAREPGYCTLHLMGKRLEC